MTSNVASTNFDVRKHEAVQKFLGRQTYFVSPKSQNVEVAALSSRLAE
jgi:hypothetical protein